MTHHYLISNFDMLGNPFARRILCGSPIYKLVTYEAALFEKCKGSLEPSRLKGLPPSSCFPKPCGGHRDTAMNPQDYIENCRKKRYYKAF